MATRRTLPKQSAALGIAGILPVSSAAAASPALPGDLVELRAMSIALSHAEMDPITRARQSLPVAYAAVAVAFTDGVITTGVAKGLISGFDALLNTREETEGT